MKNKLLSPSKRLYGKFVTFLLYSIDFYVDPDFSHEKLEVNRDRTAVKIIFIFFLKGNNSNL